MQTVPLWERSSEVATITAGLEAAGAGAGSFVLVEGPAGIGKSALLERTRMHASTSGIEVCAATGATLERHLAFGIVRQLLEERLASADAGQRDALLSGVAALAAPVLSPDRATAVLAGDVQAAVVHGLYWLVDALAARCPLVLVIDDLQWADDASLHFVAYLARRLSGLAVAVVAAVRTGDPDADTPLLREVRAVETAMPLRPSPLSVAGVADWLANALGTPDDAFVAASHDATGGNPFLIGQLVSLLARTATAPTVSSVGELDRIDLREIAATVRLRLDRLHPDALTVARAVAVLGRHARSDRISAITGLDPDAVRSTRDLLVEAGLLQPGASIAFDHPLVDRAVYADIPTGARSDAHRRAADLLASQGAPVEERALHLMRTEPAGRPATVATLRAAATRADDLGAQASVVAYLRRADAEAAVATARQHATLLHRLGRAEALLGDPAASGHLVAALQSCNDPMTRAAVALDLSELQLLTGDWRARIDLLDVALTDLERHDVGLAARIEASRVATVAHDIDHAGDLDRRLPHLRSLVDRAGPAGRSLALAVAAVVACTHDDHTDVPGLVAHGLDGGRFLAEDGPESLLLVQGVAALVFVDLLDAAADATREVIPLARRRGSRLGACAGWWYRGWISAQRGDLEVAESHLRQAVDLAVEHEWVFALPTLLLFGIDAALERPGMAEVSALVDSLPLETADARTGPEAYLLLARGRLRMGGGKEQDGMADLRAAGRVFHALGRRNPLEAPWRSTLALAVNGREPDEARALAEDELADATRMDLRRARGVALRALGLVSGGATGLDLLTESLRELQAGDAALEVARTQVELGAALRRADRLGDARAQLRAGLDGAARCGADRLAARATDELRVAGARPRRHRTTGPDALTASERRVARMATEGLTNREVAQALFVSAKTVEHHLTSAYRKLGIAGRHQLGDAFDARP